MNVFVSVGSTATPRQEDFVRAVEERLLAEGLVPRTVGRNVFSADSPFVEVTKLMGSCDGVVVIALERIFVQAGKEKREGASETTLADLKIATPWNQIEATMGYMSKLPLLVLVEEGVRQDGLLEKGLGWYVQTCPMDRAALNTSEFNGVLASWKQKMSTSAPKPSRPALAPGEMTVGDLLGALKPGQLWSVLGALAAALAAAFALGAKLIH